MARIITTTDANQLLYSDFLKERFIESYKLFNYYKYLLIGVTCKICQLNDICN